MRLIIHFISCLPENGIDYQVAYKLVLRVGSMVRIELMFIGFHS